MRFRLAGAGDAALVKAISAEAYVPAYRAVTGEVPRPACEEYGVLIETGEVWLAEIDGEPSGVLVLERRLDHLLVYSVAVVPRRQGGGLGKALLALAEERARAKGAAEIRLYTNRRMERNLRLYHRCGFVETGQRPHPSRPGEVLVDMVKSIA